MTVFVVLYNGAKLRLTSNCEDSCRCTVPDTLGSKGITSQTDWREKHTTIATSRKLSSVEELETLHAGTKPRTSRHQSRVRERPGKRNARQSFLKGRERAIPSDLQNFKATMGTFLPYKRGGEGGGGGGIIVSFIWGGGGGGIIASFSERAVTSST